MLTRYRGFCSLKAWGLKIAKPSFSREQFNHVMSLINQGTTNVSQIGAAAGLQRMAVARIKADPAAAEAMLRTWAM